MSMLLLGLVLLLGVHSVSIVAPARRDAMAARLGAGAWKGIYSLVSLVGFLLLLKGYALARLEPSLVWVPPVGLRHVAALLMLPVFPLLFAAYERHEQAKAAKQALDGKDGAELKRAEAEGKSHSHGEDPKLHKAGRA